MISDRSFITIKFCHCNRFTRNETLLIYESVLSHQGVAMLPNYLITASLQSNKLVALLPEYKLPEMGIFLVFTSKKYISPAVRKFIDFLSDEIPKSDWHQL
ncbi:MAG: hypothetical protein K2Q18_18575 [Bdellovibrionales bacterium]|nr:hypothetical protein [Bdellovibrionales bacterium]